MVSCAGRKRHVTGAARGGPCVDFKLIAADGRGEAHGAIQVGSADDTGTAFFDIDSHADRGRRLGPIDGQQRDADGLCFGGYVRLRLNAGFCPYLATNDRDVGSGFDGRRDREGQCDFDIARSGGCGARGRVGGRWSVIRATTAGAVRAVAVRLARIKRVLMKIQ